MKVQTYLNQSPLFALYRGHAVLVEAFQARLAVEGVHFLQGLILTALLFEEREVRPLELSQTFQVSKSNLSHSLKALEKKAWLKRSMHAQDARGYLFALTAAGRRKAVTLVKIFDEVENALEKSGGVRTGKDFAATVNLYIKSYGENFDEKT